MTSAAGITAVVAVACAALTLWDVDTRSWRVAATAFQFIAALGILYPLLGGGNASAPPADAAEAARGAAAAARLYTMLAGASAALYWAAAAALLHGGVHSAAPALRTLRDGVAGNGALRFLVLDFAGLAAAAVLFGAAEAPAGWGVARGAKSALYAIAAAALLSPAAPLALALAEREGRLAAGGEAGVPEGRLRRKRTPAPKARAT
jgi:hypothetical protein